jgi:hypothetical protein
VYRFRRCRGSLRIFERLSAGAGAEHLRTAQHGSGTLKQKRSYAVSLTHASSQEAIETAQRAAASRATSFDPRPNTDRMGGGGSSSHFAPRHSRSLKAKRSSCSSVRSSSCRERSPRNARRQCRSAPTARQQPFGAPAPISASNQPGNGDGVGTCPASVIHALLIHHRCHPVVPCRAYALG